MPLELDQVYESLDELTVALARLAAGPEPRPIVKERLLARISQQEAAPVPSGFSVRLDAEDDWLPHAIPGIRVKVLSLNERSGYATLLLDVKPGTHFPAHHHHGAEECYVISGSVLTLGRRLGLRK